MSLFVQQKKIPAEYQKHQFSKFKYKNKRERERQRNERKKMLQSIRMLIVESQFSVRDSREMC